MRVEAFDPTSPFALRDPRAVMVGEAGCGCCVRPPVADAAASPRAAAAAGPELEAAPDADTAWAAAPMAEAGPLPVYSAAQVGEYLRAGFWDWYGDTPRKFNLGAEGTGAKAGVLRYSVSGLDAAGAFLATEALALYSRVLGIAFEPAPMSSSDIVFNDSGSGAVTDWMIHAGTETIRRAFVTVSRDWLDSYGATLGSYGFSTYVHEIGHALGLGHAGPYNGGATFVPDAGHPDYGINTNAYLNDSWQASIMSYIDQDENAAVDASYAVPVTPMAGDWAALGAMYGISPAAFAEDTVWGFNTTITGTVYAEIARLADKAAFTIIDAGGIDTLDFSGFAADQTLDLGGRRASSVGGLTGNLVIADGVVIENAVGGRGDDRLTGNAADNVLRGGAGDDRLFGRGGDDRLAGGPGADRMQGGPGDDRYVVDDPGDVVVERAGGGRDLVVARIDHRLGAHVEALRLAGPDAAKAVGNALGNTIEGNRLDNTLRGLDGADTLEGGRGADVLIGGRGRDLFRYASVEDSTPEARDVLRGGGGAAAFQGPGAAAGDRFDFSLIDADVTLPGRQSFVFGTVPGLGRLWAVDDGKTTLIRGNVERKRGPELEIAIKDGDVLASAYSADDFLV